MLKADVKKGLDSLISASMARNIRDTKRPSLVRIVKLGLKTNVESEAIVIGHGQTNRDGMPYHPAPIYDIICYSLSATHVIPSLG